MFNWAGLDPVSKWRLLSVDETPPYTPLRTFASTPSELSALAANDPEALFVDRGWAGVPWNTYGSFLTGLETAFNLERDEQAGALHPVFAFGYDWRQSSTVSAALLASFVDDAIAKTPGASRAILVTHSFGGFVSRAACLSATFSAKIAGVIYVAHPSNGTIVTYRRFHTGATARYDGSTKHDPASRLADQLTFKILVATPEEYTLAISGAPGPLELLPNQFYHRAPDNPWLMTNPPANLDKIYDVYRSDGPAGVVPPGLRAFVDGLGGPTGDAVVASLMAKLDGARAFHERLANSAHPNSYVLYGTGLTTDAAIDCTTNPIGVTQAPLGDGTVHEVSSSCPNLPAAAVRERFTFSGVEHGGACSAPVVWTRSKPT